MSERDLYYQSIPQIAEMIIEARKMSTVAYEEWKNEILKYSRKKGVEEFTKKVISVIEEFLTDEPESSQNGKQVDEW